MDVEKYPSSIAVHLSTEFTNVGQEELVMVPDVLSIELATRLQNELQTLPNSLSNLQNLRVINISENPLNGVPEVLFTLPKLEKLFF